MNKNKMSNQFKLLLLSAAVEEANFQDILIIAAYAKRLRVAKRKQRFWIHPILNKRKEYGAFYHLVRKLELDEEKYIEYFRMSPQQLDMLLSYVGPLITIVQGRSFSHQIDKLFIGLMRKLRHCSRFFKNPKVDYIIINYQNHRLRRGQIHHVDKNVRIRAHRR